MCLFVDMCICVHISVREKYTYVYCLGYMYLRFYSELTPLGRVIPYLGSRWGLLSVGNISLLPLFT